MTAALNDAASPDAISSRWGVNLRRKEAARYLRENYGIPVAPATLAKWHCTRSDGPPAHHAGRVPLYPRVGLDEWARKHLGPTYTCTSDRRAA